MMLRHLRLPLLPLLSLAILLLCCISSAHAKPAAIAIKSAKISVTSQDGSGDATYTLKEPTPLASPIHLNEGSTLKLTFTVVDSSSDTPLRPSQAHLLFEDPKGPLDVTLPISVKPNGRGSFTINTAKLNPSLTSTHGPLSLTLLLSSHPSALEPLQYPLGTLSLASSLLTPAPRERHDLPPRQGEPAFQAQQELFHTFKPEDKTVGVVKSAVGTGAVLAPWALLALLIGKVGPSLEYTTPPSSFFVFFGCLVGAEVLIFIYWLQLKLYQFLPAFLALSLVTAYTGKLALSSLRQRRLARKA